MRARRPYSAPSGPRQASVDTAVAGPWLGYLHARAANLTYLRAKYARLLGPDEALCLGCGDRFNVADGRACGCNSPFWTAAELKSDISPAEPPRDVAAQPSPMPSAPARRSDSPPQDAPEED
ncbi:MAG TPA: hypothetical protein VNL16_07940 [Chloroflexota bacterium]|nr:hypothetical protein [Chloroflexota bacterium]